MVVCFGEDLFLAVERPKEVDGCRARFRQFLNAFCDMTVKVGIPRYGFLRCNDDAIRSRYANGWRTAHPQADDSFCHRADIAASDEFVLFGQ